MKYMNKDNRTKKDLLIMIVGCILLGVGVILLIIKTFSAEYVDAEGILHENFFLLPLGYFFSFAGIVTLVISGILKVTKNKRNRTL